VASTSGKTAAPTDAQSAARLKQLEQQLTATTLKLKDAEIWAAQREGVIAQQNEQLEAARGDAEALKREIEAGKLRAFGDGKALEEELKQLKKFLHITERISGGAHLLTQAAQELRRSEVKRSQIIELQELLEGVDKAVSALRADLQHKRGLGSK
jgi:chromosome segregation ATPase